MGFVRHRQSQRAWDDVAPAAYDDPSLEGVERHDLIGALDEVPNYHVRYFHVEPGKQTRREQHPHDHGVVIQNGRARVTLGDEVHEVGPGRRRLRRPATSCTASRPSATSRWASSA